MKKVKIYVMVAVAILATVSCSNQGFKRTKSGLQYKIISSGSGPLVKRGEFLKVTFAQKVHDSLLSSTNNGFPAYVPVDSARDTYNPAEVFGLLHKGDSCVIIMEVDSLVKRVGQLPPFLKKRDKIVLYMKVQDILANNALVNEDREKYMEQEKDKEIKQIETFLAQNSITNAKKTAKGVYYQILSEGNGPKADSGKLVSVKYTGYDLEGKPFDSNTDSTKQAQPHPLTAFEFKSGVSGAIGGMLDAIQNFKKGDKGKLFVPAMLGYGPQGAGNVIKPFENLVFDIEVVDVKDAPAQPKGGQPQMSMQQMQQMQQMLQQQRAQQR